MKRRLLTTAFSALMMMLSVSISGQSTFPQGFNYQAIARNASGNAIINADMKVSVGILSDTIANTLIWEEEHTVRTNGYGLFTLVVGGPKGTRTGGSAATFGAINWAASQMFVYIRIKNPASAPSYTPMGKAKLWSVPYAMLAGKSQQDLSSPFLSNGDTVYLIKNLALGSNRPNKAQLAVIGRDDRSDDPLFEVRRRDGQPVFTVYNDAVTINVPIDGKKGSPSRGGFAVGGFDETKGTYVTDLLRITPDSVRFYINNSPSLGKGSPSRGGFAVGGFDETKSKHTELFRVTHDSTRIYTNETSDKGFAVGYLTTAQTRSENLMKLNKSNYFIGHQSGRAVTTGTQNTFLGYQSGLKVTTGTSNVFVGQESGYNTTQGHRNIFIGYQAGYSNIGDGGSATAGHDNIYIGRLAGRSIQAGEHNTLIGSYSGYSGSGTKNTFLGAFTGFGATGIGNVFIGVDAGRNNTGGNYNIFLGPISGNSNSGNNNTFLGYGTGYNSTTGSNNVFIGYTAGWYETGSNLLYIDNSATETPLIYGNFSTDRLTINGNTGIRSNPVSYSSLYVEPGAQWYGMVVAGGSQYFAGVFYGDVWAQGTYETSDISLKKNIAVIDSPLKKIMSLRGVTFDWANGASAYPRGLDNRHQIGLIAQEVEKVFPELVREDHTGLKAVSYNKLTPVLLEAIKEQQKTIENLEAELRSLDEKIKRLEAIINGMTGN